MLSDYEFNKYLYAHLDIAALKEQYEKERAEAYENVSPTQTICFYDAGKIVAGSVSVEEHVVFLMDLCEKYQKRLNQCEKRLKLLHEAESLLYEAEFAEYEAWKVNHDILYPEVLKTLRECLEYVLGAEHNFVLGEKTNDGLKDVLNFEPNKEMNVKEWDAHIEAMSDEELFSDYYDSNDSFDKEIVKRRAFLRERGRISEAELNERAC